MGLLTKGIEQRKYPRYNKKISVHIKKKTHKVSGRLKPADVDGQPHLEAVGKDISRGGLCFYSDVPYEPETVLQMTIRISGVRDEAGHTSLYLMASSIPVRATVKVAWCRPAAHGAGYEVGVAFTEIYGDDYKILQKNLTD
jgi:hypothetical protein